jgi:hypothetical protein
MIVPLLLLTRLLRIINLKNVRSLTGDTLVVRRRDLHFPGRVSRSSDHRGTLRLRRSQSQILIAIFGRERLASPPAPFWDHRRYGGVEAG